MKTRLPNLLIPGAAKAGTTSLYHYLAAHPQCAMSRTKETYFFTKCYSPGNVERYAKNFSDLPQSAKIIGEASPTYLSIPEAAKRIRAELGRNLRFVLLLRNPVDRATSAFWHVQKRAADQRGISEALLPPFETLDDALLWEQSTIQEAKRRESINVDPYRERHDDPCWNFRYLRNSSYLDDLRRFESIFSRGQMLIVLNEELSENPIVTFQRIARFLKIDPTVLPTNLSQHYNASTLVKSGVGPRLTRFMARRLPLSARWRECLLESTVREKLELSRNERQRLANLFREHNQALQDEFGVNTEKYWD